MSVCQRLAVARMGGVQRRAAFGLPQRQRPAAFGRLGCERGWRVWVGRVPCASGAADIGRLTSPDAHGRHVNVGCASRSCLLALRSPREANESGLDREYKVQVRTTGYAAEQSHPAVSLATALLTSSWTTEGW